MPRASRDGVHLSTDDDGTEMSLSLSVLSSPLLDDHIKEVMVVQQLSHSNCYCPWQDFATCRSKVDN